MEQTQCSETSAIKHHTPENNPKGYTRHTEHGESLKSRISWFISLIYATVFGFINLEACLTTGLFQKDLSTWCDPKLPPSNESILSFRYGHTVDSYIFFLVFLSLPSPLPAFLQ
jgi:hypothetical protein